jgi:predicted XRE-type DNA-binding protein
MRSGPKKERSKAIEKIGVEPSSGNVFEDLGLPDSAGALAKAELAARITGLIEERGLTQVQAAKVLGIDQPSVSALLRGRLRGFSSDRLFRFLNALGRDVEIVIRPHRARGPAGTKVVVAARRAVSAASGRKK